MRPILACMMLSLTACVATPPIAPAATAPHFSALDFFDGRTEGTGMLHVVMSGSKPVRVHGRGHLAGSTLILDQIVDRVGKPPKHREWHMREGSSDHYTGTLTDARGPISGEAVGNRLHLKFRSKGGFDVQQWLTLAADGRSAHNIMVVRKFGLKVAVLDETIRRLS